MAKPIGKTFVEIEIDAKKYNKGVVDVKTTTKKKLSEIEKAWKGLGKKSEATYDQMRAAVNKNYDKIKTHALSTADDILRAEKAKNEKIARINKQQFGDQKSLIDKAKEHWVALSVAAVAAIVAIGTAITGIIASIKEWVDLAAKQELAEINLAAALEASGTYTDALNTSYQNYATSIQDATKYGDEEVLTLMSLMTNLGVTTDKLEKATEMTIGLATATGRGTNSMATYVALALQGEFTMLRRYIPALRKTTDATEQMKIVQDFAARGFQVAQKQTDSYAIGIIQLGNLYGDLKEKLGDFIIKNETVIELMKRTKTWLIEVADKVEAWRKANQELINQKTEEVFNKLAEAVEWFISLPLKGVLEAIVEVFKFWLPVLKETVDYLTKFFETTKANTAEGIQLNLKNIAQAEKIIETLKEQKNRLSVLHELRQISDNAWQKILKRINSGLLEQKSIIDLNIKSIKDFNKEGAKPAFENQIKKNKDAMEDLGIYTASALDDSAFDWTDYERHVVDVAKTAYAAWKDASEDTAVITASALDDSAFDWTDYERHVVDVANKAYNAWRDSLDDTSNKTAKIAKKMIGFFADVITSVASTAENIASKVSSVISEIWSGLKSVMGMVGGVITFFITFPGDLQESLERFAKSIKELPEIVEEFFAAADTFFGNLPEIITTFIESVGVFIEGIVAALPRVVDALITELPRLVDAFIQALPIVMDALIAGAEKFTLAIVEEIPRLIEAIMAEIPGMVTSFMEVFLPAILDMIPKVIEAILQGIPDIIKALSAGIPTIVTSLIDAIVDLIPILVEEMPVIVEALTTAMIEDSPRIIDALIEGVPRIVEALVKAIGRKITPSAFDFTGGYDVPSLSEIVDIAWPFHKGGIVGQESQSSRFVSAAAFSTAPRAHKGFMPNEVPIIAKRGEGVFTPEQMAALGGVNINSPLINIGGNLIADKQTFDDFIEDIDYALTKLNKRVYA